MGTPGKKEQFEAWLKRYLPPALATLITNLLLLGIWRIIWDILEDFIANWLYDLSKNPVMRKFALTSLFLLIGVIVFIFLFVIFYRIWLFFRDKLSPRALISLSIIFVIAIIFVMLRFFVLPQPPPEGPLIVYVSEFPGSDFVSSNFNALIDDELDPLEQRGLIIRMRSEKGAELVIKPTYSYSPDETTVVFKHDRKIPRDQLRSAANHVFGEMAYNIEWFYEIQESYTWWQQEASGRIGNIVALVSGLKFLFITKDFPRAGEAFKFVAQRIGDKEFPVKEHENLPPTQEGREEYEEFFRNLKGYAWLYRGRSLYNQFDDVEGAARRVLEEEIKEYFVRAINPDQKEVKPPITCTAEAHYWLGQLYFDQNRLEDCIKELDQAIAIKLRFADACYCLGRAYYRLGELDDAVEAYEKALSSLERPDLKPLIEKEGVHYYLGRAYHDKWLLSGLDERLEKLACYHYREAGAIKGFTSRIPELFTLALRASYHLARIYHRLDNWDEARPIYETVASTDVPRGIGYDEVHYVLRNYYSDANRPEEAGYQERYINWDRLRNKSKPVYAKVHSPVLSKPLMLDEPLSVKITILNTDDEPIINGQASDLLQFSMEVRDHLTGDETRFTLEDQQGLYISSDKHPLRGGFIFGEGLIRGQHELHLVYDNPDTGEREQLSLGDISVVVTPTLDIEVNKPHMEDYVVRVTTTLDVENIQITHLDTRNTVIKAYLTWLTGNELLDIIVLHTDVKNNSVFTGKSDKLKELLAEGKSIAGKYQIRFEVATRDERLLEVPFKDGKDTYEFDIGV